MEQIIDWSREEYPRLADAVSAHPYREGGQLPYLPIVFVCAECETPVDAKTAAEMEEQVL